MHSKLINNCKMLKFLENKYYNIIKYYKIK